jgi:hypothetical protein
MKHPLDNTNSSDSEASPPAKKTKLEALEAILDDFGPITEVSFEPFECEPPQPAKATLPTSRNPRICGVNPESVGEMTLDQGEGTDQFTINPAP